MPVQRICATQGARAVLSCSGAPASRRPHQPRQEDQETDVRTRQRRPTPPAGPVRPLTIMESITKVRRTLFSGGVMTATPRSCIGRRC